MLNLNLALMMFLWDKSYYKFRKKLYQIFSEKVTILFLGLALFIYFNLRNGING